MTFHEILHHSYVKKKPGIILKLDFKKAYDKVSWDSMWGFDNKWVDWIRKILVGGTVSVKLNDITSPYFQSSKGCARVILYLLFLFNITVDYLTKMVTQDQENGLLKGVASDLVPNGVAILQYADDTILCFEDNPKYGLNLKLLLFLFEVMLGSKFNFLKIELFAMCEDESTVPLYAEMFNCQIGSFPFKYLGMP
jgi:hypothetical protein